MAGQLAGRDGDPGAGLSDGLGCGGLGPGPDHQRPDDAGAGPLDGIRRLQEIAPASPLLVVTGNEEDELLPALFRMGIAGFAPKTSHSATIKAHTAAAIAAMGAANRTDAVVRAREMRLI